MNADVAVSRSSLIFGLELSTEGRWLATLLALTSVELVWWAVCWTLGLAPAPVVAPYLILAFLGLVVALAMRFALRPGAKRASLSVLVPGTMLIGLAASLFLPLKYAIPNQVPFWLDTPLALIERQLFGDDPWRIADRIFGWALVPVDRVYGLWLPVQALVLFSVMLLPASNAKSRALIAYGLAWFLLGVVAAVFCASAGPIFYDRLLGGHHFASLNATLESGAWMVRSEADAMWASFASGRPTIVAGMSAMPSLHVAVSFWMWLAARSLTPRLAPFALAYVLFIWIASVQLGWHYVSDGLGGVLGMALVWWLAKKIAAYEPSALATSR